MAGEDELHEFIFLRFESRDFLVQALGLKGFEAITVF
jgi:hypothetical protein